MALKSQKPKDKKEDRTKTPKKKKREKKKISSQRKHTKAEEKRDCKRKYYIICKSKSPELQTITSFYISFNI